MDEIRINKYIATCGICSRRGADALIEEGRVAINGLTAKSGDKVGSKDIVTLDGNVVTLVNEYKVLAFNKPAGVVVTENDEHAKVKITDLIDYPIRVTYAGRLDKDSEGLILLTNDGALIDSMMRGKNGHEKEYIVKTNIEVSASNLDNLRKGIYLEELKVKTKPCVIEQVSKLCYKVILTEGLNRQIRRMFSAVGAKVINLKRVRVVNIKLDELPEGKFREIKGEELRELYRKVNCKQKGE